MTDTMVNASYVFWMLASGWCMGTAFDFYSTVTGATKLLRWLRPFLDLVFWVASGFVVYYLTFITIQGTFRVYTFLLIGVGYLVYRVLFRRVVIGSAFAIVRFVRGVVMFFGRLLYRLIGVPILVTCRVAWRILCILYALGCHIEDGISAVIRFVATVCFFPLRRFWKPERAWRKKLQAYEQVFWDWLSNVLKKKPRSVS
ncbi:spore cortex biosynthesis protein YabQ [Alicyclobacillus fastidiosus]|uniref:Spore cortex biosynthesis protein YabQ n=1 Tax=Alicyclobacillus fastidiosus TaxID=392011 RepID=A0ABY6ZH32_9BACL|nr:spore cortex biosynthesis protein YabQ [Alicyclobacillus fastidiosus]WAH42214.1 spore cortex biosynthesis protein YabQ [Alicyclobacillus fastidiosus]